MTDIRDAFPHTDDFEPRSGGFPFGISPEDQMYGDDCDDDYDDDYDDPLADPDERPVAPLPLEPAQRVALARAVQAGLNEHGCDNTLRAAKAWARRAKVRWGWLRAALEDRGGFCDCEVLLNVVEPPPD